MKKSFLFFAALASMTLAFVSCQKDELEGGDGISYLEQPVLTDTQAKVFMNPDTYKLFWKKNDNVRMYTNSADEGTKLYTCPLTGDAIASTTNHTVSAADAPAFLKQQQKYAFYPEFTVSPVMNGDNYSFDGNGDPIFVVDLPNQQVLDNDINDISRLHLTRFPRAAKCASGYTVYNYKNLCGILVLWLSNEDGIDGAVEEIKFEANEPSNGGFQVSWTGSRNTWNPVLTPVDGYTDENKVTKLVYHQPIAINNGYQQFFISLPQPLTVSAAGTYAGYPVYTNCKITITSSSNHVKVLEYPEIPITRNQMTLLNFGVTTVNNFVAKSGIFTVEQQSFGNPTKKVYFSPGNLQYKNTNWQFAAQQYEVLHGYSGSSYTTAGTNYNQDLFGWSTTRSNYGQSETATDYYDGNLDSPFEEWGTKAFGPNSPWYTMPVQEWEVLLYKRKTDFNYNQTTVRWVATTIGYSETVEHDVSYTTGEYWENNIHYIYNPNIEDDFEYHYNENYNNTGWVHNYCFYKNPKKNVGWTSTGYTYEQDGILIFPDDFTLAKWNAATNSANIPYAAINNIGRHPDGNGQNMDMVVLSKQQLKALEEYGVAWLPAVGKATMRGSVGNYSAPGDGQEGALYYWTATPYEEERDADGPTGAQGETSSAFQLYVHNNGGSYGMNGQSRTDRCAVRLVREAPRSDW